MNIQHLPCVAIIVAVCAVVLCVALSFWIDGWKRNLPPEKDQLNREADQRIPSAFDFSGGSTIPNEQAKRRAMWAKIVRKM